MREIVLNDLCQQVGFAAVEDAVAALSDGIVGIRDLIKDNVVRRAIRLPANSNEIVLGHDFTLYDVVLAILKKPELKERGALFASLLQLSPVDKDLPDDAVDFLLNNKIEGMPESYGLLLCAYTNHVALSIDSNRHWDFDNIKITVREIRPTIEFTRALDFDNISRAVHAAPIAERHRSLMARATNMDTFWQEKESLFPYLLFGLDVAHQVRRLDSENFKSAVERLLELNAAAAIWCRSADPAPKYASKITGESTTTMQKYGDQRDFRNSEGRSVRYELHARIANGHRIYIMPIQETREIEIGYIGPHLSTDMFPS